jgi:glutamate dehydrogenase (NAD(P)+)
MGTNAQTMAWLMDEFHRLEGFQPACVTGKPTHLFGALGREEATGRGVAQVTLATLEKLKRKPEKTRVAIQGFGNVGRFAALVCEEFGMKVVAVSDISGMVCDPKGLDIKDLSNYRTIADCKKLEIQPSDQIFEEECDVFIPAALGGVINDSNYHLIKADIIVEGANQPITGDADMNLKIQGTIIVPDILANSGGVMGSYFEWTQNIQQFSWEIEKFRKELDHRMKKAFHEVNKAADKYKVDLRSAAYLLSVDRVNEAFKARGSLV